MRKGLMGVDVSAGEAGGIELDARDPETGLGVRLVLSRKAFEQIATIGGLIIRDGERRARQYDGVRGLELRGEIQVTAAAREAAEAEAG